MNLFAGSYFEIQIHDQLMDGLEPRNLWKPVGVLSSCDRMFQQYFNFVARPRHHILGELVLADSEFII